MNQQQIAELILAGVSRERFRLWHSEGGRFDKFITGEDGAPTRTEILRDIIGFFDVPKDFINWLAL